jgi:hypothetical protein
MAKEELKWQNIDADDLPAAVKKSFEAMVEAEAAFKADLEKLLSGNRWLISALLPKRPYMRTRGRVKSADIVHRADAVEFINVSRWDAQKTFATISARRRRQVGHHSGAYSGYARATCTTSWPSGG